jgi:calcyclin binding protein
MDSSPLDTIQKDIIEIEKFLSESTRPNIKRVLNEQKRFLTSSLDSEKLKKHQDEKEKTEKTESTKTTEKDTVNYVTINKYAFESSDKFAKLYFMDGFTNLKAHPQDKILTIFKENSFTVCIMDWNGTNYRFACNNLNKPIVPKDSYVKTNATGMVVYLRKEKSDHWDGLEKKKSMVPDPSEKTDKTADPSAGLMEMMKEMYQNGDDNTKRMIAESWSKAQEGKMGGGGMPGMEGMGGMPGGMPDMSGMGGMPGMEGMGGMPDMSKFGGMGGMPDMSKFGGKGGMPDLSQLEGMGK